VQEARAEVILRGAQLVSLTRQVQAQQEQLANQTAASAALLTNLRRRTKTPVHAAKSAGANAPEVSTNSGELAAIAASPGVLATSNNLTALAPSDGSRGASPLVGAEGAPIGASGEGPIDLGDGGNGAGTRGPPLEASPVGCLVQVSVEELRTDVLRGQWGEVLESTDSDVVFRSENGARKNVPAAYLAKIPNAPAAKGPWKKNPNYLTGKQRERMVEVGCLEFPKAQVNLKQLLSESEMSLGCFEILWRLTPRRALIAPPFLTTFSALHSKHDWAVEAPEGGELVAKLRAYAERAELLLLPILAEGHWTLLALQRGDGGSERGPVDSLEVDAAAKPGVFSDGCPKCDWSAGGCRDCNDVKAQSYSTRMNAEMCCLDPLNYLAPLAPCAWWDARYYDSLGQPSRVSSQMAVALMDVLQPEGVLNTRAPEEMAATRASSLRQGATSQCAWYCLHFAEEAIRRYRGEGRFSFALDKERRVDLLRAFGRKLGHAGCL